MKSISKADDIPLASLEKFLPEAGKLTWEQFCNDCPKQRPGCFPCKSARVMYNVYLGAMVAEMAKNN